MIYILYAHISKSNHEYLLKEWLPKLSPDLRKRVCRYRNWQDAQLSVLGRILLYNGVSLFSYSYNDLNISYTKYKKPYFENGNLKFNISHSGELVTCALTTGPEIGIDVEFIRDIDINDFKSEMTIGEWSRIYNSEDRKLAFYQYWTEKEAIIKASGKGLSLPLKSFEVSSNHANVYGVDFYLRELNLDSHYKCCLASNQLIDDMPIHLFEFDNVGEKGFIC